MSSDRGQRALELFEAALAQNENERETFLDQTCAGDVALRAEVKALLLADAEAGEFLEPAERSATQTLSLDPMSSMIGQQIGRYKIRRLIASGGMGSVYEAQQEQPRRAVALKLMKRGIASRSALRRFEYEAQLLGRLRHPNIAQVYEAGTHDDGGGGVPYFAMEYIPRAVPITNYAVANKLTIAQRLELFIQVCDAVYHGHQKGIIHRDLKPSNILVDSAGQPKIIDFGVARSTDSDMALTTIQTSVGQLIGTLQYMSPEQCEADPHDIDTRSDVYALGVVLYELLCDKLPYDVASVAMHEATRIIREQNPTRLRTINRRLGGDVETITLKALEKDRVRRYHSAAELAEDIRRYLSDQPITARPPSVIYQLRTFARRNRTLVGGLAAVFVVLIVGLIVSTSLYFRAQHEAQASGETNEFFRDMLASIDPMQLRTLAGLAPGGKTTDVTGRSFGRNVSVSEMMRQASGQIEKKFSGKPLLEASARETIGMTFKGLGLEEDARPQLEKALEIRRRELGDDHPDTWRSMLQLAFYFILDKGLHRSADDESLVRVAYEGMQREYGDEDPQTLTAARILADIVSNQRKFKEADSIFHHTLDAQRRVLGLEHRDTLITMCYWAHSHFRRWGNMEGLSLALEVYEISRRTLGPDDYLLLLAELSAGAWRWREGRFDLAEPIFEDLLAGSRNAFGEDHLLTYWAMLFLTHSLQEQGREEEQEQYYRQATEGMLATVGEAHRVTQGSSLWLGALLLSIGEFDEAIRLAEQSAPYYGATDEDRSWGTIAYKMALQFFLRCGGRPDKAREILEQALDDVRYLGEEPEAGARALNRCAWHLLACHPAGLRDPAAALPAALKAVKKSAGKNPYFFETLAMAYQASGDLDRAVATFEQALAALPPDESWSRTSFEIKLVAVLREKGDDAAADSILRHATVRVRDAYGEDQAELVQRTTALASRLRDYELGFRPFGSNTGARLIFPHGAFGVYDRLCNEITQLRRGVKPKAQIGIATAAVDLASAQLQEGGLVQAEELLRTCLGIQKFAFPEGGWRIAETTSILGTALAAQQAFDEAEPLLIDAYGNMQADPHAPPKRTQEALTRIVDLYAAWGKPEQAAEWRARLTASQSPEDAADQDAQP